jgi:hypothetical protein
MGFYEKKLAVTQVKITNTSGSDYDQGDFVLEQGYFGNVVNQDGIANAATGIIDINSMRIVETDQTKAGDTFAESTDETPSVVYFDRTNAYLTDTNAAGLEPVGTITSGGAADANDVIRFKPYEQSQPSGVVPAGSISTTELADEAVTVDKMADLAQGSLLSGQASDRPAALDVSGDGEIIIGDGTDVNAVAVTGDVTITNAGVTSLRNSALLTATATLTAAEVKTLYSANTNQGYSVVDAPGAGKVIEMVSAVMRYNYDGVNAYTAANGLTFNVGAVAVSDTVAATFLQATADQVAIVQALSAEINDTYANLTNKALFLQEGTADPTGSGVEADTLTISVTYRIIDVAV